MITIIDGLDLEPHQLYHVSSKQYDFPCRQKINEARAWSRWHPNGVLGLWTSTFPNRCKSFGQHVYAVSMQADIKVIGLTIEEFMKLTNHMKEFDELITFLCGKGDMAYILDASNLIGEVIILNFDKIESFIEVTGQELIDREYKIRYAE